MGNVVHTLATQGKYGGGDTWTYRRSANHRISCRIDDRGTIANNVKNWLLPNFSGALKYP